MNIAISILLFIVGLINFVPVIGVMSADRLSNAYSIELVGNDIVVLMRHRALLFGIIGGFILYSVFNPSYQIAAVIMAAISMLGFLYFVCAVGDYNGAIAKVAIIDLVGIAILAIAAVLKFVNENG
ncbi:hypothetical protein [Zhongshania arctica]|uniref:Phosphopantetheine adenylyltransferase n=1 Tax=Zhongshania arctica TaxID=3238302 RepID=A0ABV3TVC1_9GAMM